MLKIMPWWRYEGTDGTGSLQGSNKSWDLQNLPLVSQKKEPFHGGFSNGRTSLITSDSSKYKRQSNIGRIENPLFGFTSNRNHPFPEDVPFPDFLEFSQQSSIKIQQINLKVPRKKLQFLHKQIPIPICSMYGMCTNTLPSVSPSFVGKYSIHLGNYIFH